MASMRKWVGLEAWTPLGWMPGPETRTRLGSLGSPSTASLKGLPRTPPPSQPTHTSSPYPHFKPRRRSWRLNGTFWGRLWG